MTTTNNGGGKDPNQIVMATVTYKDGHEEKITGARFIELIQHYTSKMRLEGHEDANPNEKEELEALAEILRMTIDFMVTPEGAPPEWEDGGKTMENLKLILGRVNWILENYDEWSGAHEKEIPQGDAISQFIRGTIDFMQAPRPRGYEELLKISDTGVTGRQLRTTDGAKISTKIVFLGRNSIEEQKIRQAFEFQLLKQNPYGVKAGLDTRVRILIEDLMKMLNRPINASNKSRFKALLEGKKDSGEGGTLYNIRNSHIDIRVKSEGSNKAWIQTNIGQASGIVGDYAYFQFSEDYARYINTGVIKPYHKNTVKLGSRQFPLPYYLGQKLQDHYFFDGNRRRNTHNILSIKALLDYCAEVLNYEYIIETDPTHWKRKIKDQYERALNEIKEKGLFDWEYCGPGCKEIQRGEITGADFEEWSRLYITFRFIPEEPPQDERLQHKRERIEAAKEKKAIEDAKAIVEADKIRKRKRKQAAKRKKKETPQAGTDPQAES